MAEGANETAPASQKDAHAEMGSLRRAVSGVVGSIIAGVDGLLLLHDLNSDTDAHDIAALSAAMFGLGRQAGIVMRHGPFREATIRSRGGYFSVYAINDRALLAVVGNEGLNIARLHLEARAAAGRLNSMLDIHIANQARL